MIPSYDELRLARPQSGYWHVNTKAVSSIYINSTT